MHIIVVKMRTTTVKCSHYRFQLWNGPPKLACSVVRKGHSDLLSGLIIQWLNGCTDIRGIISSYQQGLCMLFMGCQSGKMAITSSHFWKGVLMNPNNALCWFYPWDLVLGKNLFQWKMLCKLLVSGWFEYLVEIMYSRSHLL